MFSTDPVSSSPTDLYSVQTHSTEADAERRLAAWKARGITQDRLVRQRFIAAAVLATALAVGALASYGMLVL